MRLHVLSDLHLIEASDARLFKDERQGAALARFCESVQAGDELVLLGDTLDLTGMTPPSRGLARFFSSLGVPREVPAPRAVAELCRAALAANPQAARALAALSQRAQVTLVPGNHDWQLGTAAGAAALQALGLRVQIAAHVDRMIGGRRVRLVHGHEYDKGNARPGGPGEAMTQILHQAVLPFLSWHGAREGVRMEPDRVLALRPEEAVLSVVQRWLPETTFRRFFRAFLRLLAQNGAVPAAAGFLAPLISADRVRRAVERQDRLWESVANRALRELGPARASDDSPDVMVMGHTHVLDWARKSRPSVDGLYVNLGTWTERCFDAESPPDDSMPLLTLDDASGRLTIALRDLASDRELQRASL